jgi:hypothetical protein
MTHANMQPPLGPRLQQLWATRRRLVLLVVASVVAVIVVAVVLASGGSHDKYWTRQPSSAQESSPFWAPRISVCRCRWARTSLRPRSRRLTPATWPDAWQWRSSREMWSRLPGSGSSELPA